MRRIHVIGTSCSGKSTFAAALAARAGLPHVELDSLHWEPNWVEVPDEVFHSRVAEWVASDAWVVDGNYSVVRDLVWARADTVVWLDYRFPVVFWRALRRTAGRVIERTPCCNGIRETLRQAFSRHSILLWVVQSHWKNGRRYREMLPSLEERGKKVIVLRSPGEAKEWLSSRVGRPSTGEQVAGEAAPVVEPNAALPGGSQSRWS